MKQFNCEGLEALSMEQVTAVNGGSGTTELVKKVLKKGIWGYIIITVIDNWDDLKQGFVDGWNDAGK